MSFPSIFQFWIVDLLDCFSDLIAGTGIPDGYEVPAGTGMGRKCPPRAFTGTGTGKSGPRGDGDRKAEPDGEFPVAIFRRDNGVSRWGGWGSRQVAWPRGRHDMRPGVLSWTWTTGPGRNSNPTRPSILKRRSSQRSNRKPLLLQCTPMAWHACSLLLCLAAARRPSASLKKEQDFHHCVLSGCRTNSDRSRTRRQ
jgi:hypothetical protein